MAGFKLPKVSIKPVSEWGAQEVINMAMPGAGVATKAATDFVNKKPRANNAAAQADANALSSRYEGQRTADRAKLEQLAGTVTPGVQVQGLDPAFRAAQMKLMTDLQARASGQTRSLAEAQFQQDSNTALQKSMGAIRAGLGSNPALAGRTAALASTNALGNTAAQSGMMRLKEQQDAQAQLAQLAATGRTGDMQARAQDIGLGQSNQQAAMQQTAQQANIYNSLLGNTEGFFGNIYDRGQKDQAIRAQGKGGGGTNDLIKAALPIAGATIGTIYGGPAGGAAGSAAGGAAASGIDATNSYPGMALRQMQPESTKSMSPGSTLASTKRQTPRIRSPFGNY